jgi:hypothetical protein
MPKMQKKDFQLENNIYPGNVIGESISAFAWFDIAFEKWILTISWNDGNEIEETFNEFMNYVLWIYNEAI